MPKVHSFQNIDPSLIKSVRYIYKNKISGVCTVFKTIVWYQFGIVYNHLIFWSNIILSAEKIKVIKLHAHQYFNSFN